LAGRTDSVYNQYPLNAEEKYDYDVGTVWEIMIYFYADMEGA